VRTVGDNGDRNGGEDGVVLKLMRCIVIECSKPVFSINVSFGFLIFGEESGVRVFNLRPLVKGLVRKVNNLNLNSNLGMNVANEKLESRGLHTGLQEKEVLLTVGTF